MFKSLFGKDKSGQSAKADPVDLYTMPVSHPERRTRERRDARPGTRVMIIDDSQTILVALKKTLRSVGYETCEFLDAEQGLESAFANPPDLNFLDIMLPGMNGFTALRQLRQNPLTKNVPVIMISGNEQATEQFFGARIGADDFMKKPFSRIEVFARIEHLLDEELVPRRLKTGAGTTDET